MEAPNIKEWCVTGCGRRASAERGTLHDYERFILRGNYCRHCAEDAAGAPRSRNLALMGNLHKLMQRNITRAKLADGDMNCLDPEYVNYSTSELLDLVPTGTAIHRRHA